MNSMRRLVLSVIAAGLVLTTVPRVGLLQSPGGFAARVAELSERGGYFDTDNLISNERSYLHVVPALREPSLSGGAYIGVGPDQNFSYIAQVKPTIAFIVDIRRDNLLLHLLFKALFEMSQTRAEYLSQLFGRPPPSPADSWRTADIERLIEHLEGPRLPEPAISELRTRVNATIRTFGVPLSGDDLGTIDRFHRRFMAAGVPLKFQTTGRAPQSYYPSYRELMLETDREGHRWSFLADEGDFQFVRSLQQRDLVIPVVGDLAGPSALVDIGKIIAGRGERLSVFYASNVEFYLFADGKFPRFVDNLGRLPHSSQSLLVRSVFGALGQSAPGYYSSSLVQRMDDLLQGYAAGRFHGYPELTISR
jgi:hypothetical protein